LNDISENFSGSGIIVDPDTIPGFNTNYYFSEPNIDSLRFIESVYPNTTTGSFTIELNDSVLVNDKIRVVKIVNPITNVVIDKKTISGNQKNVNFDIGVEASGNYGIKVIEENRKVSSEVLIKVD